MRTWIAVFSLFILVVTSGLAGMIVCDNQPRQIYLVAVHPTLVGFAGFYYSEDSGENIELRDSTGDPNDYSFGGILADEADNVLYRGDGTIYIDPRFYVSWDGGFHWDLIDTTRTGAMASGVISGELYRRMWLSDSLERSNDYGVSYNPCTCLGGPDSLGPHSAALGIDSGEVYVLGDQGKLYYSQDYAESFSFLVDLNQAYGIHSLSYLFNGQLPGEVFVFEYQYGPMYPKIWRATGYGATVEMIAIFNELPWWYCSLTTSHVPGELYLLAQLPEMVPGGTIHIYHTTDYFQTYTMYEHVVEWEGVNDPLSIVPSNIDLHVFPNPANAAFGISYQLPSVQQVNFKLYNTLGHQVWQHEAGIQSPGSHLWHYHNEQLPSGAYFLELNTGNSTVVKTITIIK